MHTDVLIVGGGPAGLSTAIAARMRGLRATLVDSRKPPIDKPCGEGLLPGAVAALAELGVATESAPGIRFSGIRFSNWESSVHSRFAGAAGFGIRRTSLHALLVERAAALGVRFHWGSRAVIRGDSGAEIGDGRISFRWLIGADGLHSRIRRQAGLGARGMARSRFAFRRHFEIEPWTDLVEVHWSGRNQMIVTPTGAREICVALFTRDPRLRIERALPQFPEIERRIRGARPLSAEAGSRTLLSKAKAVTLRNTALVGDASCSIDGIAGQGLSLAFQEAIHLAGALEREDLRSYERAHRTISRVPVNTTRLMLLMANVPWIQRKALRLFAAKPALFANMMAVHSGKAAAEEFGLQDLCGLGWQVLCA